MQNKKYFLDFLNGCGKRAVLFEPFITQRHTETLIWRRGTQLWDTPEAYIDTLLSLSERTLADVIFCDMRKYDRDGKLRLLKAAEGYAEGSVGIGMICGDIEDSRLAEVSDAVCVICAYGGAASERLPVIRMDGSLENAVSRGEAGFFARDNAEEIILSANGRIRILGGLGDSFLLRGATVETYDEVERLMSMYLSEWACGSGSCIPDENYLDLISLLGAFGRVR